jgi:glucan phosphoethanolaminetransferase (alkaline phosphatase superfamily)
MRNNLILTALFSIFTIGGQLIYYATSTGLTLQIPLGKYFALILILFIFSFIKQNLWRFISMGMIYLLSFFQMVHLEFFGLPVHATEIYLLFTQTHEIVGTIKEDFYIFILPTILVLPGAFILWKCNKKFVPTKSFRFLYLLFIFYFVYNPTRTFITSNTWGRQPSTQEFDGMNIYISFSYFLGRILPYKLRQENKEDALKHDIQLTFKDEQHHNIIVVQGESLSPNHMSLFGYQLLTTPFLDSIQQETNFIKREGISSGVSTDIAVAFFMNTTYGINGNRSVFNAKHCLFKLAKDAKYETHFYSTQSQQQLRYIANSICPKYIDHYKNLELIDPNLVDENEADDHKLVDELIKINLEKGKNFVLLHQRGSHSPYNKRFNELSNKFTATDSHPKAQTIAHYDNSVYHFDLFMQKLIDHVKSLKTPTLIFVISDHGEALGEENLWGHGMLRKPAFLIPILIYGHKTPTLNAKFHQLDHNPTHLNVSLLVAKALGYQTNVDALKTPIDYTVLGNDMDGFAGFLELEFEDGILKDYKRKDI